MSIRRVEDPFHVCVRAVLDHLAHELLAQSAPAVLAEDVDVGEVREREAVRERAAEANLALTVIESDDARGLVDQPVLRLTRASLGPVRLLAEEAVHLGPVDALLGIVQLQAV